MIICVDFDGTVCVHEYPKVGRDIGAQGVLKELVRAGHQLILWTMRDKKELKDAVKWFSDNSITLHGVNCNPTQKSWTSSPKAFAHLYIDDMALGAPLVQPLGSERPYIDWKAVHTMLTNMGVLPQ